MLMVILVAVAMVVMMAVIVTMVTSSGGVERKRVEKRFSGSVGRKSAPELSVVVAVGRLLPPGRQPLPETGVGQQQHAGHDQ